jgi:hypothetical protein
LRQTVDAADESLTASGVFHISDGGAAQAPPEVSRARIDPEPSVVNGAPMTLAFLLVGGTGELVSDNKIEQATSRTVHVRRWERGRWVEVVSRESVRVRDTRSTVTLPELAPGLYQLARTKSSGDEIRGWLFVTPAVAPLDNAMTSQRCSASSAVSADIDGDRESDRVYLVFTDSGARLGACTTSGQSDEVDCAGQAENLLVVPMPQPQRTVIMCGGSSVSEVGLTPYVWELESSTLRKTPLPDSDNAGFTSGRAPDGLAYEQFGCLPKIGGDRVIAQLRLENRGSAWAWTRRAYSITRDGARLVDTQSGTVPTPTQQFVDTVVPHCGGISPSGEEPRIVISP